jgi:Domain of unknown function (DUF4440)
LKGKISLLETKNLDNMKLFGSFLISLCPFFNFIFAQVDRESLANTILLKDSLFWDTFNNCDLENLRLFFSDNMEFYHDRNGLVLGLENLTADLKKNLCGNENLRLRREAVKGSVKVFPLRSSSIIYGAIISGEHVFYVLENGRDERLDGLSKFTHVWILADGTWKMSRMLSYDHGPAPYVNHRKSIKIIHSVMDQFIGQYLAPQAGICNVRREGDQLCLTVGEEKYLLHPLSEHIFFVKDRDLTFDFVKTQGKVSKMTVRENGKIVEVAEREN